MRLLSLPTPQPQLLTLLHLRLLDDGDGEEERQCHRRDHLISCSLMMMQPPQRRRKRRRRRRNDTSGTRQPPSIRRPSFCPPSMRRDLDKYCLSWKDVISGFMLIYHSSRARHNLDLNLKSRIRYYFGGMCLCSITGFTIYVSCCNVSTT